MYTVHICKFLQFGIYVGCINIHIDLESLFACSCMWRQVCILSIKPLFHINVFNNGNNLNYIYTL